MDGFRVEGAIWMYGLGRSHFWARGEAQSRFGIARGLRMPSEQPFVARCVQARRTGDRLGLMKLAAIALLAGLGPFMAPANWAGVREGDPSLAMAHDLLNGLVAGQPSAERLAALSEIALARDERMLAPIVDLLRFAESREEWLGILAAAEGILGRELEGDGLWSYLTQFLADSDEVALPPGYAEWKGRLLAHHVDPRMKAFLYEGVTARVRLDEVVWGGVTVDGIPALVDPKLIPASQATYLTDTEPVFGVAFGGEARAYPLRILDWHEMANDVVGGVPFALAYCTLCGAGVAYDRRVGDEVLTFGSSGLLMRSNKLMYDRASNSLWNQLTGRAVVGVRASGETVPELKLLPIVLTSWSEWKRKNPKTTVLGLDTGFDREYFLGAAYGQYFASPETMFRTPSLAKGERAKEQLFVVRIEGVERAYSMTALSLAGGALHDEVGGKRIVVVGGRVESDKAHELPKLWRELSGVSFAKSIDARAALELLSNVSKLDINDLTVDAWLAIPEGARFQLLEQLGPERSARDEDASLRGEIALRGLLAPVRAFEAGELRFTRSDDKPDLLLDQDGAKWRVGELALIGPQEKQLPRLSGHLVYRFGLRSFFPAAQIFGE